MVVVGIRIVIILDRSILFNNNFIKPSIKTYNRLTGGKNMEIRMSFSTFIKLKDFVTLNDISSEIVEYHLKNDLVEGIVVVCGKYHKHDMKKDYSFSEDIPFVISHLEDNVRIEDVDCVELEYSVIESRGIDVSFDIVCIYEKIEDLVIVKDEVVDTSVPASDTRDSQDLTNDTSLVAEEVIKVQLENEDVKDLEDRNPSDLPVNEEQEVLIEINQQDADVDDPAITKQQVIEVEKEKVTEEVDKVLASTLSFKDDNFPETKEIIKKIPEKRSAIKIFYYNSDSDLNKICDKNKIGIDRLYKENKKYASLNNKRVIISE